MQIKIENPGGKNMTEDLYSLSERLIFCCSGASNVGILSFRAAIRLAREGFGTFSCIAGIGSRNPPMIRNAKSAGERVVIDGCPIGCARKIMDMNLIPVDRYIIVTELGIEKTHGLDIDDSDIESVVQGVKDSQKFDTPDDSLPGGRVKPWDDGP
jgi:uncharacterized metal-binding protein